MKEQLAAMTIIELVRTAHSYATSIQQIDTYSAIVTELASRLEALNLAHIGGMNAMRSAISERDQMAAENEALKTAEPAPFSKLMMAALDAYQSGVDDVPELAMLSAYSKLRDGIETPATDAWQREQRQKAWAEGINYTAGRLAAAFNHGCVNKPMAEVGDIVRMILTTKDDLANDPAPAADGLSGEYAEKALEDWEQQLRAREAV